MSLVRSPICCGRGTGLTKAGGDWSPAVVGGPDPPAPISGVRAATASGSSRTTVS